MIFDEKDIQENKWPAAVAYLWVLFLIPLLVRPKSVFAQAHAKQGLVLFVAQALSSLVIWVPILGQLWNIIIFFVVPLVALSRALAGKYWEIPLIASYARRVSFE
ncbi:hypothetical protein HY628_03115 [Candidatus Uhrbacteria bacterium]|nr:hypothetical protein [Candidatus Uhrbacteria bacterium]